MPEFKYRIGEWVRFASRDPRGPGEPIIGVITRLNDRIHVQGDTGFWSVASPRRLIPLDPDRLAEWLLREEA